MPRGVGRLSHIRRARVGLGVGVAVHHPHHLEPAIFGIALDQEMLLCIDRVHTCRLGHVFGGMKLEHLTERTLAHEQPACFMRIAGDDMLADLIDHRLRYA